MQTNKLVLGLMVLLGLSLIGTTGAYALFGKGKKKEGALKSEKIKEVVEAESPKETIVSMQTEKGEIQIKLFMDDAPVTAGNFKDLVNKHFYDGITFHRLISGFMIQGGCPKGDGTGGYVDPETKKERRIPYEGSSDLKNLRGRVAMARTNDPNSASSQFFINLVDNSFLDHRDGKPGYAVFGEVVRGMEVVDRIMKENVAPFPGSDGSSNKVKIKQAVII